MMERAADAWEHQSFKDIIVKVANLEIYYRALNFYLQEQPSLLTDLLAVLTARIDVTRVVRMFEKSDNIPLIKPFLLSVQAQNNKVVNNAINDILIEEEDYKTLRDSVANYDNYDPLELAQRLEQHEYVFGYVLLGSGADLVRLGLSFSDRLLQASTANRSAGANRSHCPNKIGCSRMPSRPLLCQARKMLLRNCFVM